MSERQQEKDRLVTAVMTAAGAGGWENLSLQDIAGVCDVPLSVLHEYFEDKTDILVAFGRMIDRKVLENIEAAHEGSSQKDILFDVFMDRFEALNEYRGGVCAVLRSFRFDPKQAVISLPHLCRSMTWMLEAAGVETLGLRGALKVTGMTGIYLRVLKVWSEDESADMAATMAALDKALSRAENWANNLGL